MRYLRSGFTLVEIMIVIMVIAILAGIVFVSYGRWQYSVADKSVQNDVTQATASLASFKNFQNNYPPNLAGTNFAPSPDDGLVLYTNAPSVGVYQNLTPDQNAQLLLNVCNANLNGLFNTVCQFQGNGGGAKIHVKGTNSTNVIWPSPISQTTITDTMGSNGSDYATAANTIISQFLAQGGTFPVTVSGGSSALPTPTQVPNGPADKFCLEGRSGNFPDIIYHTTSSSNAVTAGECPADSSLHYFPGS